VLKTLKDSGARIYFSEVWGLLIFLKRDLESDRKRNKYHLIAKPMVFLLFHFSIKSWMKR
jgi:hypothetical protein